MLTFVVWGTQRVPISSWRSSCSATCNRFAENTAFSWLQTLRRVSSTKPPGFWVCTWSTMHWAQPCFLAQGFTNTQIRGRNSVTEWKFCCLNASSILQISGHPFVRSQLPDSGETFSNYSVGPGEEKLRKKFILPERTWWNRPCFSSTATSARMGLGVTIAMAATRMSMKRANMWHACMFFWWHGDMSDLVSPKLPQYQCLNCSLFQGWSRAKGQLKLKLFCRFNGDIAMAMALNISDAYGTIITSH